MLVNLTGLLVDPAAEVPVVQAIELVRSPGAIPGSRRLDRVQAQWHLEQRARSMPLVGPLEVRAVSLEPAIGNHDGRVVERVSVWVAARAASGVRSRSWCALFPDVNPVVSQRI
jgi:hypothetical protein